MLIRNSILAGEILLLLEKASGSLRVTDIESVFETTRIHTYSAITRLLSEGLIELIREDERTAIALIKSAEMRENNYIEEAYQNV